MAWLSGLGGFATEKDEERCHNAYIATNTPDTIAGNADATTVGIILLRASGRQN
jgi:hypothetical protein